MTKGLLMYFLLTHWQLELYDRMYAQKQLHFIVNFLSQKLFS